MFGCAIKTILWFSALEAFERGCEISLDWAIIQSEPPNDMFALSWLQGYIRQVITKEICHHKLPVTLHTGDRVTIRHYDGPQESPISQVSEQVGFLEYRLKVLEGIAIDCTLSAGFLIYVDKN